jgi:hypothetical protein
MYSRYTCIVILDIDLQLQTWAYEVIKLGSRATGYQHETVLSRCATEGPTGASIRPVYGARIPANLGLDGVNSAVQSLPRHLGEVVFIHYLERGTTAEKRQHLGIGDKTYRVRLSEAHHRIAGFLQGRRSK